MSWCTVEVKNVKSLGHDTDVTCTQQVYESSTRNNDSTANFVWTVALFKVNKISIYLTIYLCTLVSGKVATLQSPSNSLSLQVRST